MKIGPIITQRRFIVRFIMVSLLFVVYPPCCALKDISNKPKNTSALPEIILKNIPNLSPIKIPIALIIREGVIQNRSGTGKLLS